MTTAPTPADAMNRAQVRLADGRRGSLVYVPGRSPRSGARCRVQLDGGAFVSVDVEEVALAHG